jgi:hypothetical protein
MNMTEAEFDDFCEGVGDWPCWAMFRRYMERDEIRREFDERWAKWDRKQYVTNNGILRGLASNDMRRLTIAQNEKYIQIRDLQGQLRDIEGSAPRPNQRCVPEATVPNRGRVHEASTFRPNPGNATQNNDNTHAAIGFVIVAVICWFLVSYFGS